MSADSVYVIGPRGIQKVEVLEASGQGLAVTRSLTNPDWACVTHVPTGLALAAELRPSAAKALMQQSLGLMPWAALDLAKWSALRDSEQAVKVERLVRESYAEDSRANMEVVEVPKFCERCGRNRHLGLHLWHPSSGATMGSDDSSYTRARWFARAFICHECRCVIYRRLQRGRIDRWLLRRIVWFKRGGS